MKSPLIVERTSGSRKISAVPVFWSRSFGASKSGFGRGSEVRWGFVARADLIADAVDGGAMRVISRDVLV